jgi:hypothetical protein
MVAEDYDHPAPGLRCFSLKLLKAANDPQRIRTAVGDVAELDQSCVAACPMAGGVDDPGSGCDGVPCLEIAVEIADSDNARRRSRLGGAKRETGEQKSRRPDDAMDQPLAPSRQKPSVSPRGG